jgi:aerobic-type carbon monoxide dehydrogenase small subunit (CoxS/CutS family)
MNKKPLTLTVNGESREIMVEPRDTLLEVLREKLLLSGAKEACGTGECGACTVLVEGRPVLACLTLAVEAQGKSITTVEGLSQDGKLTPLQRAFIEHGGVQCGFCTPGMILSATALLKDNPSPTRAQIRKALEGNLCRCTGYNKIIESIENVRDSKP